MSRVLNIFIAIIALIVACIPMIVGMYAHYFMSEAYDLMFKDSSDFIERTDTLVSIGLYLTTIGLISACISPLMTAYLIWVARFRDKLFFYIALTSIFFLLYPYPFTLVATLFILVHLVRNKDQYDHPEKYGMETVSTSVRLREVQRKLREKERGNI